MKYLIVLHTSTKKKGGNKMKRTHTEYIKDLLQTTIEIHEDQVSNNYEGDPKIELVKEILKELENCQISITTTTDDLSQMNYEQVDEIMENMYSFIIK